MIEREIEIFRADTSASRGITAAQLAECVDDDFAANPRAFCFGHPKSDDPAAGTIKGARVEGNRLFATVNFVADAVDGIKSGKWINRSAAFFRPTDEANPRPGKWSLRHVGLLGGSAPGIPGMTPLGLAFSADGELEEVGEPAAAWIEEPHPTPIIFSAFDTKEPTMSGTEQTPEQIEFAARKQRLADAEAAHAARVRTQFEASNGAAIDNLVREAKVLPAEADALKMAFNAFDPEAEELTFGAGDKATKASAVSHLLSFMATAIPKRITTGDRLSPATEFDATGDAPKTPLDFNARVQALADKEKLTFDAAAERLAEQTGA